VAWRQRSEELFDGGGVVLKEGNEQVILCERGIRTFETAYRSRSI